MAVIGQLETAGVTEHVRMDREGKTRLLKWPDHGGFVFISARHGPMSPEGVRKMIARTGEEAALPFPVHPHMLRHGCGFALANAGHDTRALQLWLGHRNIQHTVRYTELSSTRFKTF